MKELSFKSRLGIFLGTAFFVLFLIGGTLFVAQYRLMGEMTQVSDLWTQYRDDSTAIRAQVGKIELESSDGQAVQNELRKLGQDLKTRRDLSRNPEIEALFSSFSSLYEKRFLSSVSNTDAFLSQDRRALVAISEEFLRSYSRQVSSLSQRGHLRQKAIFRWASFFLVFLGVVGVLLVRALLRMITLPLEKLTSFVDHLDLEGELPEMVPVFSPAIPEVMSVARSFDRLLERLRGYRALKIKRILSEKKRAEWIAASISDGIFLLKEDEVLYANPVARKILAYGAPSDAELELPHRLRHLLSSGEWGPISSGAGAIMDAVALAMPVEFSIQDEDGDRHFLLHAGIFPVENDQKTENQTLIVAQDVTLVRESQEAKGHFLGTLSHEIKTPVTSLTMAIHLLERMVSRTEKKGEAETIPASSISALTKTCVEEVDRLRKLLDEFLSVSRLDILARKVESQRIDFIKLVRNAVQGFQATALARGIFLNFEVHSEFRQLWLSVDPSKLTWALSNLLTNAIRHTPKGGLVEAKLEVFSDRVEVKVRDTGSGIEPKKRKNIFEKFSPYYDIRVARTGSTGAGLSIAREIISAHGGQIWVSGASTSGAEFCFTLPLQNKRIASEENLKGEISGTSACSG